MSGRLTLQARSSRGSAKNRGNDPGSDPEPPMAPPVIILSASEGLGFGENQGPEFSDPHSETKPRPPTNSRYNLRRQSIKETATEPDPSPEPEPEPESAPPIIILPKRPASSSPSRSTSPPISDSPTRTRKMGSKSSKVSPSSHHGHSKLQPATANSDKAQMKEPPNYYSRRSKSMRRKAGRNSLGGSPATTG
ncbi:hypothetical protein K505DRAFT_360462 [Melanomma pulvis-pyrius CBS 109.77]|uniref:Uncharacterized protein n=1 Tax=Melanomma pulvis-pyrius CBS 109.77 TaxID=1314802 RepID=A0A6A6XGV8_9PLEO|nr:hypothetical protein K505DRAFT_360462 [Melanomma pulvis-pyrius CBS 109.77]